MSINKLSKTWKWNGEPLYEPAIDLDISYESLSAAGSGRNEAGQIINTFVARVIPKVQYKLSAATTEEISRILQMVQGQEGELTYPDPYYGRVITWRFYVAGSGGKLYSSVLYDGLHRDVTFNFVGMDPFL